MMETGSTRLLALIAAFLAVGIFSPRLATPVHAQEVMARGYYNHIESRISAYIPGVTSVDQVDLEQFTYGPMEDGHMIDSAWRASYTGEDGTRYSITSVDFATPEVVAIGRGHL